MGRFEKAQEANAVYTGATFTKPFDKGRPKLRERGGRPSVIDQSVLAKLEEAFSYGCPMTTACSYAGISYDALHRFVKNNPDMSEKIERLRNLPEFVARRAVYNSMKFDGELGLKYLERKLPEEFSLKAQVQHNVEFTGISLDKPNVVQAIATDEVKELSAGE